MLEFDKVGVADRVTGAPPEKIYIDPISGTVVEQTGENTSRVTVNGVSHNVVGKHNDVADALFGHVQEREGAGVAPLDTSKFVTREDFEAFKTSVPISSLHGRNGDIG